MTTMKDADADAGERAATSTSTISLSASAASTSTSTPNPAATTASNRGDRGNDGSNKSRSRRVSFAHSHRSDNVDVVEDPPSTVAVTPPAVEEESTEIRRVSFAHLDDNKEDIDLDLPQTRATATDGCNGELTDISCTLFSSSLIALLCYPKRC